MFTPENMIENEETSSPIGIFDSGYGGLTNLKEIIARLPNNDYIYLGDNARTPYGNRSFDVVYQYTLQAVNKLFSLGCQLVILACNTASAKALRTIQQVDLPKIDASRRVLGVIRPAVESVKNFTKTNHVGILGTIGTVNSESYPIEIKKLFPEITTTQEACPMWVPLVENNEFNNHGADYFIQKNIQNLLHKNSRIDTVILGCTHYPLLLPKIKKYMPRHIAIISQGEIVANSLSRYLQRHPEMESRCSKNGKVTYLTTEAPANFNKMASIFMGKEVEAEKVVIS